MFVPATVHPSFDVQLGLNLRVEMELHFKDAVDIHLAKNQLPIQLA